MRLNIAVAEIARRPIDAVGDQDVVAGTCDRQQRGRDRRQSRGHQRHPGAACALELAQRALQRLRGRRAAPAVLVARAVRDLVLRGRIEHGRGVINRRIDEAVLGFGIAAGGDQTRFGLARGFGCLRHDAGISVSAPLKAARGHIPPDRRRSVNPLTLLPGRSVMRTGEGPWGSSASEFRSAGFGPAECLAARKERRIRVRAREAIS